MTFWLMLHHWHQYWHHRIQMALHSISQEMKCIITLLVIWHYWYKHWCNIMLMVSSMIPLQSTGRDIWNKVQHDIFVHVTPLAPILASQDTNGTAFHKSRNEVHHNSFGHVTSTGTSISINECHWNWC